MTDSIRVVFLIDALGLGGAERLMPPLLNTLSKCGLSLRVGICYRRQDKHALAALETLGIPVDVLDITRLRHPANLPTLLGWLQHHQPDIVHTQLELSNTLGTIASRLQRRLAVTTLHTNDAPEPGTRSHRRLKIMWWVLRHCANGIITVSEDSRQHHLARGKLSGSQVTTIYNGIEIERFAMATAVDRHLIRNQLNIPDDRYLVTTVAVLRQLKGVQHMLAAWPRVCQQLPNAHYLVVGRGDYEPSLQAQARELGVGDTVTFAGMRQDVPRILSAADLFVLPTLDDALPTVLSEAMASGLPVIASRVGGVPEMIHHQVNGLLVEPADPSALVEAISSMAANPEMSSRFADKGRQVAQQRFSVHQQAKNLLAYYHHLLQGAG